MKIFYNEIDSAPFEIIGQPELSEIIGPEIFVTILDSQNIYVGFRLYDDTGWHRTIIAPKQFMENDYFFMTIKLKDNIKAEDMHALYSFKFLQPNRNLPHKMVSHPDVFQSPKEFDHSNGIVYFKSGNERNVYTEIDSSTFQVVGAPKLNDLINVPIYVRIKPPKTLDLSFSVKNKDYQYTLNVGQLYENDCFSMKIKLAQDLTVADLNRMYCFRFLRNSR